MPQAVSDAQRSLHSPITARRISEEWRPQHNDSPLNAKGT